MGNISPWLDDLHTHTHTHLDELEMRVCWPIDGSREFVLEPSSPAGCCSTLVSRWSIFVSIHSPKSRSDRARSSYAIGFSSAACVCSFTFPFATHTHTHTHTATTYWHCWPNFAVMLDDLPDWPLLVSSSLSTFGSLLSCSVLFWSGLPFGNHNLAKNMLWRTQGNVIHPWWFGRRQEKGWWPSSTLVPSTLPSRSQSLCCYRSEIKQFVAFFDPNFIHFHPLFFSIFEFSPEFNGTFWSVWVLLSCLACFLNHFD